MTRKNMYLWYNLFLKNLESRKNNFIKRQTLLLGKLIEVVILAWLHIYIYKVYSYSCNKPFLSENQVIHTYDRHALDVMNLDRTMK